MTTQSSPDSTVSKVPCPHCGKKLADKNGVFLHIKAKHGGNHREIMRGALVIDAVYGIAMLALFYFAGFFQ